MKINFLIAIGALFLSVNSYATVMNCILVQDMNQKITAVVEVGESGPLKISQVVAEDGGGIHAMQSFEQVGTSDLFRINFLGNANCTFSIPRNALQVDRFDANLSCNKPGISLNSGPMYCLMINPL